MNGITYGYIRVSSKDQNEDRQRVAMHDAGVDERHIFMDKQSGKDFDRPGYTIEVGRGTNPLPIADFDGIYRRVRGILAEGMTG